ncbi:hypothetical protein BC830DRAFT_833641 [Chytriomyces sp. MP71]|nr:hypothetical protein BC830DRAFT_833641 [Chytriomyces sp. MP71]
MGGGQTGALDHRNITNGTLLLMADKLCEEMDVRARELEFIRSHCTVVGDLEPDESDSEGGTARFSDDSFTLGTSDGTLGDATPTTMDSVDIPFRSYETINTVPSELGFAADEVIRVSHKTFGEVSLREFTIKPKEKLFRKPRMRQYFYKDILHRSKDEMHSSWTEIFVDFIYVGIYSQAGSNVAKQQTWAAFGNYVLLMVPCVTHWLTFTSYNNQIHHEDTYYKIVATVAVISLVLMGNTLSYTFSDDPALNTSSIFLTTYIIQRLFLLASQTVVIQVFAPKFWMSTIGSIFSRTLSLLPYLILVCFFPVDGTKERTNQRTRLWWTGAAFEVLFPMIGISLWRLLAAFRQPLEYRMALNIEHISERQGALFGIALGEIAVSFLADTRSQYPQNDLALGVLAVFMGININHLYYRSEGACHYQHAMRRAWYTGIIWQFIHTPLVIFTLSLGAIMGTIIQVSFNTTQNVSSSLVLKEDYKNLYFVSLSAIYFCLFVLRLLHREHPNPAPLSAHSKNAKVKRQRVKVPNLSQNQRATVMLAWTVLILGVGCGVREEYWNSYGMFSFGACITFISVMLMEWGYIRGARQKLL